MAASIFYGDLSATPSVPAVPVGKEVRTADGRCFKYMQNTGGAALAKGNVVKLESDSAGTGSAEGGVVLTGTLEGTVAIGARRVNDTAVEFTSAIMQDSHDVQENGHVYFFWTTGGTGVGQGGPIIRIVSTSKLDVYDWAGETGAFATALDATTTHIVTCYTRVEKTEVVTDIPVGVALTAVADDDFFWMQTEGLAPVLFEEGGTSVTAEEQVLVPSATDGHADAIAKDGDATVWASHIGRTAPGMDVDADGLILANLSMREHSTFTRNDRLFPFCMGDYSFAFPKQS